MDIEKQLAEIGCELVPKSADNQHAHVLAHDGGYVGTPEFALKLAEWGIRPELAGVDPTITVCQVGFCENTQAWHGWSHRAIYGFKVGQLIEADQIGAQYWPEGSLPYVLETLDDCRLAAVRFAQDVA